MATEPQRVAAPGPRPRIWQLDALRGLCIVAMLVAHVAQGGLVDRVVHAGRYVDGAAGFVFLSGLVLGLSRQRQAASSDGARAVRRWLLRRAATLYGIQLLLVGFAVTVGRASGAPAAAVRLDPGASWLALAARALSMQERPIYVDVLPMFVLFLLLAIPAVEALRRGGFAWVAVASLALWGFTQVEPNALVLGAGVPRGFHFRWAAWQLLFFGGLCVGWWGRQRDARPTPATRRRLLVAATAVAGVMLVFARLEPLTPYHLRLSTVAAALVEKATLGPLVVVDFAALFVLGFAVVDALARRAWTAVPLAWLQAVGQRSLRCYVAITVMAVLVHALPPTWTAAPDAFVIPALVLIHVVARPGAAERRGAPATPTATA